VQASEKELIVFAASSLTDAYTEIAEQFEEQHSDVSVVLNFAGSSQLAAQILEGAQADVFASANEAQMQVIANAGQLSSDPQAFASNRLTIIVPADNPAGITSLEDLNEPGIVLVLAVEGVPVRQYTDDIVQSLGDEFASGLYANVVSAEDNVRQVSAKVALGEADAGIVYTSDVTPDIAEQVLQITIPDEQNAVAVYPIAIIEETTSPELAQQFIDFVLGEEGQAVLQRWRFGPVE